MPSKGRCINRLQCYLMSFFTTNALKFRPAMQRNANSPAEYLAQIPTQQLPLIKHIRQLIQEAAPNLEESIRYGMLIYADHGLLFGLAAQKNYVSLYVMATQALVDMSTELKGIDHGKGCLRFKRLDNFPTELIRQLLLHALSLSQRACAKV
jgi:uncharacterized protein YdhG (YjbR/CyaY superfamily)